jgi:hypothetical protein
VPFSCFALSDSFGAVLSVTCPIFMFCDLGLILGGTEDVGTRFHVLRSRTSFRPYRGRRVPLSCFDLPDSFGAVPTASGSVFMFCTFGLVLGDTEGVGSSFHVLRSKTLLGLYRGRRIPFSCFALPDSFFGCTECVGSRFHVLRTQTHIF